MTGPRTLIEEVENSIAHKSIAKRAEVLQRVAALFVSGAGHFSPDEIALFDDIMSRLIDQIDILARAELGRKLLAISNPPPKSLRKLALDDSVEVAGTLLTKCDQLDDETLVEGAKTRSQDHLLAISLRRSLSEVVTDALVERGDRRVALSTASNTGAKFSDAGYVKLIDRSEQDGDLAYQIWCRPDVPRGHLLTLLALASDEVRQRLVAADPHKSELLQQMVVSASERIQQSSREQSAEFKAASSYVRHLHATGELTESKLCSFVGEGKFDETAIALALLCDVQIGIVERAIIGGQADQLIVLARSLGWEWRTTRAILMLGTKLNGSDKLDILRIAANFEKLRRETACKALHFYRLKEKSRVSPAIHSPSL
jgi:uncharacterized protein (DUF2336 family)